jgi:hypothetical protein
MVTPQWDNIFFDSYDEELQTTIILDKICDQSTDFSATLKQDVDAIDPVLILFLRRIERFHITLFDSSLNDKPIISKNFQRVNWTPDSGIVLLKDHDANTTRRWYKHRFPVNFDGTEIKREGIKQTDIVLAFPVRRKSGTYMPWIRKQNPVIAYLPIGDFGFKVRCISITSSVMLILYTVCYSGRFSHYLESRIGR